MTTEPVEKLTAREVMSAALITVSEDETILLAWELMTRAQIHHLPVVDAQGRCRGLLDDRSLAAEWIVGPLSRQRRRVRELLGSRVVHVAPEDPLSKVAVEMHANARDAVPVVDEDGELVGLITCRDIVSALAGQLPERTTSSAGPVLFRLEPVLKG